MLTLLPNRPVGSFLTRGYNRLFSHGLWSEMRTNSVWRENAFSSCVLTWPAERIQNTCCTLSSKNYRLALGFFWPLPGSVAVPARWGFSGEIYTSTAFNDLLPLAIRGPCRAP